MATNVHPLSRLIAACEPGSPADLGVYVSREQPVAQRLFQAVQPARRMCALLVGQTGVGKSTELHRITGGISFGSRQGGLYAGGSPSKHCIPIDEFLDLDIATWHDVLVFSACFLANRFSQAHDPSPSEDYLDLELALRPQVIRAAQQHMDGGPPEPTPMQRFRNSFRQVHDTIELGRSQFWDMAVAVLASGFHFDEFLLIWDGLEKMSLASARRLFGDEGQYLRQLPFRVIVTAPLGLTFDESFGQIEEHFSYVERLRAVSVEPGGGGERFCMELLSRRGASAVCSDELLKRAISLCGGVPRQLLQIISYAAKQALSDGQDQITPESLARAGNQLAGKWQYQLGPKDYEALDKPDEDREPAERARLLQLGACIEHDSPDGGLQIDVNPLVLLLMQKRAARAAERKGQRGQG